MKHYRKNAIYWTGPQVHSLDISYLTSDQQADTTVPLLYRLLSSDIKSPLLSQLYSIWFCNKNIFFIYFLL